MKIKLTNNFHGTEATIIVKDGRVSTRSGMRAWNTLCGVQGCICGGQLGQRGRQYFNGKRIEIEPDFESGGDKASSHAAIITVQD